MQRASESGYATTDPLASASPSFKIEAGPERYRSSAELEAGAYQAGYQAPYPGYPGFSARYVAELRKPRIMLGRLISRIAAAGAGLVLGGVAPESP